MAQARCSATLTASDTCERSAPSISARRSRRIGSPKTTAIRAPGRGTSWRSQRGARNAGRPLVVMGYAARPAFRAPRWDRQLGPLPGARIAVFFGEPIIIERRAEIDGALRSHVSDAVNVAEQRAWAILDSPAAHSCLLYTSPSPRDGLLSR